MHLKNKKVLKLNKLKLTIKYILYIFFNNFDKKIRLVKIKHILKTIYINKINILYIKINFYKQ